MKQIVRDYLTFNKRERNGVFILVMIITILLIYLNVSENFQETKHTDVTSFVRELDSLNAIETTYSASDQEKGSGALQVTRPDLKKTTERFGFDPNHLPEQDWKRLGLSEKQVRAIRNYESKGGKFRKKEDLKKMYCIKPELYASLEPYIRIMPAQAVSENGKVTDSQPATISPAPAVRAKVELNGADSATLTTVKGLGPFFAKMIIKYRNSLGGFYSIEQLLEVWKFDQEKFRAVEAFIIVDPELVRKININTCQAEQLKSPYVKWNVANAIVNYRKQHGKFKTIDEIQRTDLVDDELLRKIAPYLIVD
jgi:competence protein ComEA